MLDTSRDPAPAPDDAPAHTPGDIPDEERRGCLYALSQPPLMIFLGVIGCLLLLAAVHDLFML